MVKKTAGQLLLFSSSSLHCEQIGAVKGNCFLLLLQAQRRRRRSCWRRVTRNSSPKCWTRLRKRINRGVKWKFGGLFEQDKLYWTRTRKKELQDADESKEKERKVQKKSHSATSAAMRRGAAGSLIRKTRPNNPRRNALVTSDDCASSADEPVVVGRNYIMEEKKKEKLDQEGEITVVADECSKGNHAVSDAGTAKKALPALLQAKCEVLTMEKELAMQRWRQQCMEMAKAAEMAQTLRASVETILEVRDSHFFLSSALFRCHGKLLSFVAAEEGVICR